MKYYSDSYATIEWNSELKFIKTTLTGIPRHSHHFRLIQRKRIEFINMMKDRFPSLSILTDSRKAGPLIPDDISFFKTKVAPRLTALGVRKFAVVEPESIFSRLVVRDMMAIEGQLKLAVFCCEEEARGWLAEPLEEVVA